MRAKHSQKSKNCEKYKNCKNAKNAKIGKIVKLQYWYIVRRVHWLPPAKGGGLIYMGRVFLGMENCVPSPGIFSGVAAF